MTLELENLPYDHDALSYLGMSKETLKANLYVQVGRNRQLKLS